MTYPVFASGDVLNASDMNAVGLWLVKTQTIGSAVSSVAVTGAFSSDYDNYKITIVGGAATTGGYLLLQLGSTTTGYYVGGLNRSYGGTTGGESQSNAANARIGISVAANLQANIDLLGPNLAKPTIISGMFVGNPVTSDQTYGYAGFENSTTQHTAFTILCSAGTMTGGTIRVYGYRN